MSLFKSKNENLNWRESPFKLQVFDCSKPSAINTFHLPEDCFIPKEEVKKKPAPVKEAWILGEEYVHEFSGVVCTTTISRFRGYCSAYSHWKFMDVPEVEAEEPVTLEQCFAAKKGSYKSPDGKKMRISPGETIFYQFVEDGSIKVHPTNTYCTGVSLPLHQGTLGDESLVLTQIRFSMLREVFILKRGGQTVAEYSRIALPNSCNQKCTG